jgi:hypothetical protein
MYCKIIEKVCREPLGEIQFEKMMGKQNGRGARPLYCRTLGWSRDFSRVCGEPLRVLGTGEGCLKTLKEYSEIFVQGQPKISLIY